MTGLPRITVITPSFNQGEFIEQTIRSVLDQGYPNLEYLVMDGGSTDCTLEVLERYKGQLQYVSEPDRGQSHAINKGLHMASGEILCYLNSDDLLAPGALQKVGYFFRAHPQAHWLTGRCRMVDENGNEVRRSITLYKNLWLSTRSRLVLAILNYISQPATFWTRQVVEQVGYFSEHWNYAMDYEFWLRIGKQYPLYVLNEDLAHFRVHSKSKGGTGAVRQFEEQLLIARRYVQSPLLLSLHRMHNALILWVYHRLQARTQAR